MISRGQSSQMLLENGAGYGVNTSKVVRDSEVQEARRKKLWFYSKTAAVLISFAFVCTMIPSAVLIAHKETEASLQSTNSLLRQQNELFLARLQNFSHAAMELSDESVSLESRISYLNNAMRITRDNMLYYFDVHFTTFSNHSIQYALFSFDEVVSWYLADQICKTVQGQLAFPDSNRYTSVQDLQANCISPNSTSQNCCACWIGLTNQFDNSTWVTSLNESVYVDDSLWANGQPVKDKDERCVYIFQDLLYNEDCSGNAASSVLVAEAFICESFIV